MRKDFTISDIGVIAEKFRQSKFKIGLLHTPQAWTYSMAIKQPGAVYDLYINHGSVLSHLAS